MIVNALKDRLRGMVRHIVKDELVAHSEATRIAFAQAREETADQIQRLAYYVPTEVYADVSTSDYMKHSYPVASDFFHPEFTDFRRRFKGHKFQMHRKLWEFAYIEHKLQSAGVIRSGSSGLCFGAGQEPLPALFAARGCTIKATDAPPEIIGEKWAPSKEFSNSVADMNYRGMIDEATFFERVSYETCDMNHIHDHFRDFDFCWSSCCLEHLGSLDHGLAFIENSLKTLKVGGTSVHTTELNLSSNHDTVETGDTVLYRRKDLEAFIDRVRDSGHEVESLTISPPATPIDHHIDVPPYSHNPHLKLKLEGYVTTSVGIVIRRGR